MKKPIPFGKYYLLERVNVGGMAEVFKAKAFGVEGFERLVAVKRILPNIAEDEEFIAMFIDEAKIAVQLTHANIAQVFDLGRVADSYFIALEFVHGKDLRANFDRCRGLGEPMPIASACFSIMKVCEGLDYAHNKRDAQGREMHLVHRDVSPQNVLVSYEGEVKLVDFGIAKAVGKASQTQAGILKGKFGYMSPEQVRGLPVDRRSDVFSVGIVLYELLTGERLFVGESDFSTLEKVRNVEILPPTAYNRKIPEELERIVLRALAKDVDDRYQNAIDLHDELQAFVYTAGAFCSRKDLAAWMKKVWAKELAEDNAKLDQYRDLPPPPAEGEAIAAPRVSRPPARPTAPPLPAARPASTARPAKNGRAMAVASAAPASLEWDDEELETHVYGDGEGPPIDEEDIESATPAPMPLSLDDIMTSTATRAVPEVETTGPRALPAAPGIPSFAPPVASTPWRADASALGPSAGGVAGMGNPAPGLSGGMAPPFAQNGSPYLSVPGAPTLLERPSPLAGLPMSPPPMAQPFVRSPMPSLGRPITRAMPPVAHSGMAIYLIAAAAAVILGAGGTFAFIYLRKAPLAQVGITSDPPGADVLVNGAATAGAGTPVTLSLAEGSYLLAIQKPGYRSWDKQVDVKAGEKLALDPVALVPLQPAKLLVASDPTGAQVRVDGTAEGVTPLHLDDVRPGHHTIEVAGLAGYDGQSKELDVEAGKDSELHFVLTSSRPLAHLASTPPGAKAYLVHDGQRDLAGVTPCDAPFDGSKSYQVVVDLPGYREWSRPLATNGTGDVTVDATLDRVVEAEAAAPPPPRPVQRPQPVHVAAAAPPPAPPEPPPAAGAGGTLKVSVTPASDVSVDGKEIGWTPLKVDVAAGAHTVSGVTNDGKHWGPFPVSVPPGGSFFFKKADVDQ